MRLSLIIMLLFTCVFTTYSQTNDSLNHYRVISIKDFNNDNQNDVLMGNNYLRSGYLPSHINWNGLAKTYFKYPEWRNVKGSCSPIDMNNDNKIDIVIYITGRLLQPDSTLKDTTTSFVIFSQSGLQNIDTIRLDTIGHYQIYPFVAMNMRISNELVNGRYTSIDNSLTFDLRKIILDVSNPPSTPPGNYIKPSQPTLSNGELIKLYPNPSTYYVNLEMNNYPSGDYTVIFTDSKGEKVMFQNVKIDASSRLVSNINTQGLMTGHYIVSVLSNNNLIGSFRLIIVK